MKHQVAAGGDGPDRAAAQVAGKRAHGDIVGHQDSIKADSLPDDVTNHDAGKRGREQRING